jgi:hypothetical protein
VPAERPVELLVDVVAADDHRRSLEAIRDRLAAFLDGLSDRQVVHAAPLAKQLTDTLTQLAALGDPKAPADSVEDAEAAVQEKLRLVQ